jgi:hypothetical protein
MRRFFLRYNRGESKNHQKVKEMTDSKRLKPERVVDLLGISPKAVHWLVSDKELSCIEITNKKRRFLPEQVNTLTQSRITHGARKVDKPPSGSSRCDQKGGDRRKSVEDIGTDLAKENY